ncbi:hypothetical protein D3C81_1310550 [compost metagenome]
MLKPVRMARWRIKCGQQLSHGFGVRRLSSSMFNRGQQPLGHAVRDEYGPAARLADDVHAALHPGLTEPG